MSRNKPFFGISWIIIFLLVSVACKHASEPDRDGNSIQYEYRVPVQTEDGWETASLADVGMDTEPIVRLMNDLLDRDDHYIHGLLIVKDGKLVFEEYFSGLDMDVMEASLNLVYREFDSQTLHFQASVTKSVTSILVGLAVDKGFIPSVDSTVFFFYPEHADLRDQERSGITVSHMLAMCSGLAWDESTYPYDDPRSDTYQLIYSSDPVRFVLSKPLVTPPGTAFHYNSGTTNVLGDIVRKTSGLVLTDFAREHLFEPLGIGDFNWLMCSVADHVTFASGGLTLRPRDMAKIGQLYLGEGVWNGERILSAEWIRQSTAQSIALPPSMTGPYHAYGYGYQWWLGRYSEDTIEAYSARGWGNQYIVVLPDVEMVVVFTGGAYEISALDSPVMYYNVIQDYILSAVQ